MSNRRDDQNSHNRREQEDSASASTSLSTSPIHQSTQRSNQPSHRNNAASPVPPPPRQDANIGIDADDEDAAGSDLTYINQRLEHHYKAVRDEINARLIARANSVASDASNLATSHASQAKLIAQLQEANARMHKDLYGDDGEISRLRTSDAALVRAYVRKSRLLLLRRTLSDAFGLWRYQYQLLAQQRLHTRKFIVPYHQRRVLNSVFAAWRSRTAQAKRVACEEFWRGQMSELSSQLVNDYEHSIRDLRHQLAKAHELIQFHDADQASIESRLKQAFMRGVCAINREALTVFGSENQVDLNEANVRFLPADSAPAASDPQGKSRENSQSGVSSLPPRSRINSDGDDDGTSPPTIHRHLEFPRAHKSTDGSHSRQNNSSSSNSSAASKRHQVSFQSRPASRGASAGPVAGKSKPAK